MNCGNCILILEVLGKIKKEIIITIIFEEIQDENLSDSVLISLLFNFLLQFLNNVLQCFAMNEYHNLVGEKKGFP